MVTHNFEIETDASPESDCESSIGDESIAIPLFPRNIDPPSEQQQNRRKSVARANGAGLPLPLQQQLVQDIEDSGGLSTLSKKRHALDQLCGRKTDVCGEGGSTLRRQVQDKVKNWKKLSEAEHQEVANNLGVLTSKQKNVTNTLLPTTTTTTNRSTPPSFSHVSPQHTKKKRQTQHTPVARAKASKPTPKPAVRPPITPSPQMSPHNTFAINVNTECPEANREVVTHEVERIEGVGESENRLFKGFWTCLPIDIRFILDDKSAPHWKARIFSEDAILISIQAWPCSHLNDRDQFANHVGPNVVEALDDAHHDCAGDAADVKEARKWKHLFLKFPEGQSLSSKVVNKDAGEDEKLKLELIPVKAMHKGLQTACTSLFAAWKVARTDIKARKKGKLEQKSDKSDAALLLEQLGAGFNGMKIEQTAAFVVVHPTRLQLTISSC